MNQYFSEGETFVWIRDRDRSGEELRLSLRICQEKYRSGNIQTLVAEEARTRKRFFMKVLFRERMDEIYVEKESKVQLYSPFIVRIYGGMLDEANLRFITLMEYIPGLDLSDLITGGRLEGRTWNEKMMVCHRIVLKFLWGIHHYTGMYPVDPIVHRDLKPENVMASPDGSSVKIIDFDWVHLHDSNATLTARREQKGTPGYADPKYWNSYICRKEMDIYSAGLVLYFIYTGHHHFHGSAEINRYMVGDDYAYRLKEMPGIDEGIVKIIAKMIAPEEDRYSDIKDVIRDISACLEKTGCLPEIPELLGDESKDELRFSYRVGEVKYSHYLKNYRFVSIEYGTRQERSRNGALSGQIMSFYRTGSKVHSVILHEDCRPVSIRRPGEVSEGDLYTYAGTGIEILGIRPVKERRFHEIRGHRRDLVSGSKDFR